MKVVRFVRFTCVIIYTEESVDVPQTCTFIEVTSNFLSPVRGYAERECMSLRSVPYGQLASRQSQHIIFEPPPSFRASGGVCRSRACQLNICSTIYKTPYNIFVRGTPMGCLLR